MRCLMVSALNIKPSTMYNGTYVTTTEDGGKTKVFGLRQLWNLENHKRVQFQTSRAFYSIFVRV